MCVLCVCLRVLCVCECVLCWLCVCVLCWLCVCVCCVCAVCAVCLCVCATSTWSIYLSALTFALSDPTSGHACMMGTPKLPIPAPPTRPMLCVLVTRNTHTHSVGFVPIGGVLCPVCVYRAPSSIYSTHSTMFRTPAQTQWTCSTDVTPCFRPQGACVCVCGLFWMVLPSFCKFCTQLAPQEISLNLHKFRSHRMSLE